MRALSELSGVNAQAPTEAAVQAIWATFELFPQPVLEAITFPESSNTLRLGWARTPIAPIEVCEAPFRKPFGEAG
jgi:hypothetical protein